MDQNPHVKLKFNYQEFQNLLAEFNTQQKQGKYKPLPYNDYRLIAGKFFTNSISEVVIERVDVNNFIIVFFPTATTIYAGKMDDNSFGSFIHNYIKENQKEIMTNNTYDIWGDTVKYNESAVLNSAATASTRASDAISSKAEDYSNYSNTIGVDYTSTISSMSYDIYQELEKRVQSLAEESSYTQVDLKDIHRKLDELLDMITNGRYSNEYQFDTIHNDIDSIVSRVKKLENKIEKENNSYDKRKDNEKTMNTNKMFNFDFGFVDSNIRMSPYGMAIRNADGRYVSYDVKTGSVIDVEPFNFEGNRFMMKMPVAVKDVAVGDIVIHNHKPMFVVNTNDKVTVIDIYNGEEKNILPTINMFNFNYMTKVVSLFNFAGNNTPTAENPFGNIIPFMLMDNENTDMKDLFMMMAITNGGNMNTMFQNPMMMYIMLNNTTEMKEMLPFMMMSGAFNQTPVNNNNNSGQN